MTISHVFSDSVDDAAATTHGARRRRSGWRRAGVGLAVGAISVGSVSAWQVTASSEDQSSFVPTAPCRLFDTRPGSEPDGGNKTALGPGDGNVHTQQVTGAVGNCQIPADAVAVSMNVTAVGGTTQSNLRVFPADVDTPTASNLNWTAGQSPTPNKVDVQLSPDGKIALFNQNGTVHVVADVVGYYTPNEVDELRTRVAELESLAASQAQALDDHIAEVDALVGVSDQRLSTVEKSTPFAVSASGSGDDWVNLGRDVIVVLDVDVVAPVDGRMTVNYSSLMIMFYDDSDTSCSVFKKQEIPSDDDWVKEAGVAASTRPPSNNYIATIAGTKSIEMSAGESATLSLVCQTEREDGAQALARSLTAVFTPS
ncbi:MAG: hypothetical protein AAFY28_04055 [Actinomycetota bacterium]